MLKKSILIVLMILLTQTLFAKVHINGNWHVRVMDGMEVRKARVILDFDITHMKLFGFDGCNRIEGKLVRISEINMYVPTLLRTRMACRTHLHSWASQRLQEILKEGFYIKQTRKYGVNGIIIRSLNHELFLKKMGESSNK